MIILDMAKKNTSVKVAYNAFTLENKIITLQIGVGTYDLTDKTITAVFNPTEVEAGPLSVIDGVIKIPMYASMVQYGLNYIQLNFRWGDNYLKQSPVMIWFINKSLSTTAPAQEDIDIISSLLTLARDSAEIYTGTVEPTTKSFWLDTNV